METRLKFNANYVCIPISFTHINYVIGLARVMTSHTAREVDHFLAGCTHLRNAKGDVLVADATTVRILMGNGEYYERHPCRDSFVFSGHEIVSGVTPPPFSDSPHRGPERVIDLIQIHGIREFWYVWETAFDVPLLYRLIDNDDIVSASITCAENGYCLGTFKLEKIDGLGRRAEKLKWAASKRFPFNSTRMLVSTDRVLSNLILGG